MLARILQNVLFLWLPLTYAAVTTRTIDDTAGDLVTGAKPTYVPTWQGPNCAGCAINPPLNDVFMQTYTALTYAPEDFPVMSIQFSFTGTAVEVYFILANYVGDGVTTETMCNFTLDGQYISTFHHVPTTSTDYDFNSLVFSKDGLSNTEHTLLISTSGIDRHLYTSFDYAKYTFDDSVTSAISSPSPSVTTQTAVHTQSATQSTTQTTTQTATQPAATQSLNNSTTSAIPSSSPSVASQSTTDTHSVAPAAESATQSTTPHSSTPISTIVGGVVGGISAILIVILAILCFRRRRRANVSSSHVLDSDKPFNINAGRSSSSPSRADTDTVTPVSLSSNPLVYSGIPALPPPYIDDTTSVATSSDSARNRRQAELNGRIRSLTIELQSLVGVENSWNEHSSPSRSSNFPHHPHRAGELSLEQLHESMDQIKGQIKYLKSQLHSDWPRDQGTSYDCPPSYV